MTTRIRLLLETRPIADAARDELTKVGLSSEVIHIFTAEDVIHDPVVVPEGAMAPTRHPFLIFVLVALITFSFAFFTLIKGALAYSEAAVAALMLLFRKPKETFAAYSTTLIPGTALLVADVPWRYKARVAAVLRQYETINARENGE